MKIPIWLFELTLFLFRKKKEALRSKLESILQERWMIVKNRLHVEELPQPQLKFEISPHEASHQTGVIVISPSIIYKSSEELSYSFDHEIAHYIQYSKNSKLRETYRTGFFEDLFGNLCWILTGRANDALAKEAFREGFATYVASITSGILNPIVEKTLKTIQSGKKLRMLRGTESLPYALGYLNYCAISQTKSEEHAINLGLSADFSEWVSEGRAAFIELGKPQVI